MRNSNTDKKHVLVPSTVLGTDTIFVRLEGTGRVLMIRLIFTKTSLVFNADDTPCIDSVSKVQKLNIELTPVITEISNEDYNKIMMVKI